VAVALRLHGATIAKITADEDGGGFTCTSDATATDGERLIDGILAGVIAERIADLGIDGARALIEATTPADFLNTPTGVHDARLVGPLMTRPLLLASFDRVAPAIATALEHFDGPSLATIEARMNGMLPGDAIAFKVMNN
jgi:hypothetical protein